MSRDSTENRCPLCNDVAHENLFPIDIAYAKQLSGEVNIENFAVVQCAICKHQYIAPPPTEEFLSRYYSRYMSEAKKGFCQTRRTLEIPDSFREYYSPWLARIQAIMTRENLTLLDIGCGLGMFLRLARESGFEVHGVEPNAEAVDRLSREYSITAHNSLLENYPSNNTFDVVTMWDLLEHLAQPRMAIDKVYSLLNSGGLLVLEIPIRDSLLHWTAKAAFRLSLGTITRPLFLTYGVHHLQYFTEKSIAAFLEEHGFYLLESKRAETNLDALMKKNGGVKARLYNSTLRVLFWLARLLGKQNKLVVISRKCNA